MGCAAQGLAGLRLRPPPGSQMPPQATLGQDVGRGKSQAWL